MNRKQKIIVSITGLFIVLLALVGLTYAYFLTRITGNTKDKSISIETANLELVYGDGNDAIVFENIEPGWTTDGKNGRPEPKTFTVTNNGNSTVEDFNIYLENVINQLSRKSDLVYTITCKNITENAQSTTCDDFQVVTNEVTTNEAGETEYVFPSVMSVIATDTLEPATATTPAEVHEYAITFTYKEMYVDQSEDMDKLVQAKVNIYDSKTKFLASEILKNALSTDKYVAKDYLGIERPIINIAKYTLPSALTNKPGSEVATESTESVLSYDYDNYGTSYYYRGNVYNNYVDFAGKCWRIVRIEGDGSIKLILEHEDICEKPVSYHGDPNELSKSSPDNYIYNWATLGIGNYGFNINEENNHVISNYMTPTLSSATTPIAFAANSDNSIITTVPTVDKTMATELYGFQKTFSSEDIKKLKVGDWCIADDAYLDAEKTIDQQETLTPEAIKERYDMTPIKGADGEYTNQFFFESYLRLYSNDVKTPTFKCKLDDIVDEFSGNIVSDSTADKNMYIGALTADEVVFAGAVTVKGGSPYSYLINKNYRGETLKVNEAAIKAFYTLSPRKYDKAASRIYTLQSNGGLNNVYAYGEAAYRPVIILKNTAQITSGNGTVIKPYKIG